MIARQFGGGANCAIVVMGPSGCGKSTLGRRIADATGRRFVEGDDLHPAANVAKMARGEPLDDDDRWPWLERVARVIGDPAVRPGAVASCSALRRAYRDRICSGLGRPVLFVYPRLPAPVLLARMLTRRAHYMPASLLDSQLATLEPPASDEAALLLDGETEVDALVARVLLALDERAAPRPVTEGQ